MLEHICEPDTPVIDKKAILAEDHRTRISLKKAIREIEKEKKLLRKNKNVK